jgi:hypothetical protein
MSKTSDKDLLFSSPEEKDKYMKILVRQRLTTIEDLKRWCLLFLDVDLLDVKVSRFATSTPLEFVWDIYSFCADDANEEPLSIFGIAGRGSQKTLCAAVLQILLPLHFKRGVVHLGGTEAQSRRAFFYTHGLAARPYIKDFLLGDPIQSKMVFKVDDRVIENEILSITIANVNGPHSAATSIDELASLAPNKMAAYPSISGIPTYTEDGKPWVKFGISSRYGRYSVIETEYENRHTSGAVFKFWTVLENSKQCPDSISGTEDYSYYVNVLENDQMTLEQYENCDPLTQSKFELVHAKKGCFSCPLSKICAGDGKKQTSKCRTLKPMIATIKEFKGADYEWFLSQKMSLHPSSEDLVYTKFKRQDFEKTPSEIYEIFTGQPSNYDLTEQQLVDIMVSKGVKRYIGLDHGYTHPTALVVVYEDAVGNIYIMRTLEEVGLEPPEVVELVREIKEKYKITALFPDPAAPAINSMIKKIMNVQDDFTKKVLDGIQLIRSRIAPSSGNTKFFGLAGNCETLIDNLEKYHFKYDTSGKLTDEPVKEHDDSHDALSYVAQNTWQRNGQIMLAKEPGIVEQTPEERAKAVKDLQNNWLTQEIKKSGTGNGDGGNSGASGGGTIFWNI